MKSDRAKKLKKRKLKWIKVPFWLALVTLVLTSGAYLSYRYLIEPRVKAGQKVELTFDLNQTEHWSSQAQQKWDFLNKLQEKKYYSKIKDTIQGKTNRLWKKKDVNYPGKNVKHQKSGKSAYVMDSSVNSRDVYMPKSDTSPYFINELREPDKINEIPDHPHTFELESTRTIRGEKVDYKIWRMKTLVALQNNLEAKFRVEKDNFERNYLGKWREIGNLYNDDLYGWGNFSYNVRFRSKGGKSKEDALYVPGRNYRYLWNGNDIGHGEDIYVPGFTYREINLDSVKINGKTPKEEGYSCKVVLASNRRGSKPKGDGVTKSSSAKWKSQSSKKDKRRYGCWLSDEVNIWVKIEKDEGEGTGTSAPKQPTTSKPGGGGTIGTPGEGKSPYKEIPKEGNLPGDLDYDKDIDTDDYQIWMTYYLDYINRGVVDDKNKDGDFDNDKDIDTRDYQIWVTYWNNFKG